LTGGKTPAFPEGGRIEYVPVGTVAKLKKGDVVFAQPNILTNPIKKVQGGGSFISPSRIE
jgi:hypothetical protein